MTLVVANKFRFGIRIISDSKFSYPHQAGDSEGLPVRSTPVTGGLKSVILYKRLCISFAGDVDDAYDTIRRIRAKFDSRPTTPQVIGELYAVHKKGQNCDFIVAVAKRESGELHCIRNGTVRRNLKRAWIGDGLAHASYQDALRRVPDFPVAGSDPNKAKALSADARMAAAFSEVLRSQEFSSVNDVMIRTLGGPDGFRYAGGIASHASNPATTGPDSEGWSKISIAGRASEGGYSFEVLTSGDPSVAAVAVHFLQPGLGILYHPLHSLETITYKDISRDGLVDAIANDFQIKLQPCGTIGQTGDLREY